MRAREQVYPTALIAHCLLGALIYRHTDPLTDAWKASLRVLLTAHKRTHARTRPETRARAQPLILASFVVAGIVVLENLHPKYGLQVCACMRVCARVRARVCCGACAHISARACGIARRLVHVGGRQCWVKLLRLRRGKPLAKTALQVRAHAPCARAPLG
jgi:hypothetical protein